MFLTEIKEEQDQRQADTINDYFQEGEGDAAFAVLPRLTNPAYLAGYMSKLKTLPLNPDGTIRHSSKIENSAPWEDDF